MIIRKTVGRVERETCEGCKLGWNRLFDTFVNGLGWKRLCASCSDPADPIGRPRPYLGPYPIPNRPTLTVIEGGAQ